MLADADAPAQKKGAFMWFKEIYSSLLLIFCSVIVMGMIFEKNTTLSAVNPWLAFFVFWVSLYWLSMVEGGQASLVGLPPVDENLYKDSHPTSYKIMTIIKKGDTLDRYLMGRQFMVLALVFVENLCAHAKDSSLPVIGMPIVINKILVDTGLAVFFMTAMIGKISAQVNASRCMLDYVNTYFAYFTMQVARLIEVSGLLHCCYVVQMFFAKLSGQAIESKEAPRSPMQNLFFWLRVLVSGAILCFAFAVTLEAIFKGQTTMWAGVPNWLTVVLFFVFMSIVGMLEGMQIAFFAVARMRKEEVSNTTWAKRTVECLFAHEGRNIPAFMIGRQMCVTLCFFIIARVTTVKVAPEDPNIFGVSNSTQAFFETGLLGALITTIVASITWQLVASVWPMAYLSTPITFLLLKFCLGLEWTGIMQGSWVIARIHRRLVKFKRDEVYIGSAEERAAKAKDHEIVSADGDELHADEPMTVEPGHMYPGPATLPPDFTGLNHTIEEINEIEKDLRLQQQDIESRLATIQKDKQKFVQSLDKSWRGDGDEQA